MVIEPTGKRISWTGIFIAYFRDGKMYKTIQNSDTIGMLTQLGAKVQDASQEGKNKKMVREWFEEGWNKRNPDVIDKYFDPEFNPHNENKGIKGFRKFVEFNLAKLSKLHFTVNEQFANGDKVMTYWTLDGTIKNEYMGIPAAGKSFKVTGFNLSRHKNGKYIEDWGTWDALGLLQQIGAEIKPLSQTK